MKKAVGLLSVFLALAILACSVTPVLSGTIRDAFSSQPQIVSVNQSAGEDDRPENDRSASDEGTSGEVSNQKEVAINDGKILIYNYTQLSMIGSGKSYNYEDGSYAVYASDAEYMIVRDIPIPRHTLWQLPDGFKGKITGTKQNYSPLYDSASDSIYLYNPYQLAVMAMENADSQPVLSGDANEKSFGTGQPLTLGSDGKTLLTYSGEHNYVVSTQFSSEVTEKPVSVRSDNKNVESVGAKAADASVGAAAQYDGRDFAGQVIKKINGETYILIGNEDQLRAIGSNKDVYSPVYRLHISGTHYEIDTQNGKLVQLYGGDADLEESQNGYDDFSFQQISSGHPCAGVNQETGQVYTDATHVDATALGTAHSWRTGVKYTTDANYIIFRDIDLGGSAKPWTPLMFTGNMYGIKSVNNDKLWNGSAIGDATAMTARTTENRPVISNVYVNNSSPIEVNKFIGIGFFATITNEVNTANIGVSSGTVHVENLELSQVEVHNTATTAESTQTIISGLTSGLGWLVGGLANLLVTALSFGSIELSLEDTLSALLNARAQDPTIYSTGAFAGRVVGDVDIYNCAVTNSVTVENVKDRTGGFIGYSEGVTQYSGLSQALGITVDALSSLLNIIPGLGLGDLITILLDNALPLGKLVPTGYYEPKIRSCTADGLTGQIGHFNGTPQNPDTDYNGGFIGCQIGTVITDSEVTNGTYTVVAKEYGGGFSGIARDGEIKGTLNDLGLDVIDETSIKERINENLGNIDSNSFQSQSLLQNCRIFDSNVTVNGGGNLGGFVGALAASYAIDCDIKQSENTSHTLLVAGTGEAVGGFAGTATLGWLSTLGKSNSSGNTSLLSAVRQIGAGLLSNADDAQSQKLLSLVGLVPSAVLGVQIDVSTVNVGGKNYVGGILGRGQGVLLTESSKEKMNTLTFWQQNNLTTKTARPNYLKKLQSVTATGDYVGGVAGQLETISLAGLLDGTLSAGMYKSFEVSQVTVEGVDAGYTVVSDGTATGDADYVPGNYVAGGFGKAFGGTIDDVKLIKLQKVEAANNVAAGFIGAAGPGEVAGSVGLTVNLLGLNNLIEVSNLLSVGQHIHVTITDSDVTGVDSGYTVEAKGSDNVNPAYRYIASGFIGQSNSTEINNCHACKLLSVKAAAVKGYSDGFIGASETGGLADMAGNSGGNITDLFTFENGSLVSVNGLVDAIGYLIPEYTNCTANFVNGGFVDADVAGGFVADFESGTVDNSTIATADDAQAPKWTHSMKEIYDPDAVDATGDINKQFAVINIDRVYGRTYGGGFGGKLRSGALAESGRGISILGGLKIPNTDTSLSIDLSDLLSIMDTYVPYVKHAGVYSTSGFTVSANEVRSGDLNSGSAGGFGGYMSGAQISHCDVYQLKHTEVTPPSDLEAVSAPSYFDSAQSTYAVTGGHHSGGYVGNADIGSAASVGGGLGALGSTLSLQNVLTALSVVVTTIEHSDVQGAAGGFSAIADGSSGTVGKAGGYAGAVYGAHIQNSHCKNFYYIIGQESAGGYAGTMKPGNVAALLDNTSILSALVNASNMLSLIETFIPTIRNSTTSCVPCGGAVRAQAASDSSNQRGCAGGYCGYNEGGHIWGFNNATWQDQNDGVIGRLDFGHAREGSYTGEQHRASAWRIRSVYGAEYAGGYTGIMKNADTADTGGIGLLGGLIKVDNLLSALSVIYAKQEHTAVYGPLRNMDYQTWNSWITYVGKFGGYGVELAGTGTAGSQSDLDSKLSKYIYGYNVVAGRSAHETTLVSGGGDAGGYIGLMLSGIITDGQAYDAKLIKAMRDAGGFAGSMQTGGAASFGSLSIANLDLNLDDLIGAGEVLVPKVESSSVHGYQSGMTVTCTGTDFTHYCGYAGGYVGSAYGAQIWGDHNASGYTTSGCNVTNLRFVRGRNAVGGYAGMVTAAGVANVKTNASDGFLQALLNTVASNKSSVAKVLQATASDIVQAQVSPDSQNFGFVVEGLGGIDPQYAGGFAGILEAAAVGVHINSLATHAAADSNIVVNGLRSVDATYYAGGFFGLADVTGVANVSNANETNVLGRLLNVGEIGVIDAFRSYVYYSEVNGVSGDGFIIRASGQNSESMLSETRYSGCAGGFGGAMMNGTVRYGKANNINTVYGKNYVGGFIGHMGKSGVVDANNASVANLVGLTAGVFDIFSTHNENCEAIGIPAGAVVMATGGEQPIAGGFVGYADVSKIINCKTENLKQVYSDQIAGGFVGKTDMHYLISVEANSPLVTGVEAVLDLLLNGLLVGNLENLNLIGLNLGIAELRVLSDGDVAYINLLGLKIGVSLIKDEEGQTTDTALVTIGDSYIVLPYNQDGFVYDNNSSAAVINLIKGNRTHIEGSSVKGISIGYDVYGGGAGNDHDGSGVNGKTGGFVGFNNEGHLLDNKMEYCDVVRGTADYVGPFSGYTSLQSVYSFNTLKSIEGDNNTYPVYRQTDLTYVLTKDKQVIDDQPVTDNGFKRFDITHLAAPIVPGENEPYHKVFEKWYNAVLASDAQSSDQKRIKVYMSNAMAQLMLNTPTDLNDESLIPNPGESKDPCDQKINLTIQKVWQDQNDKNKTRPELIKVRIWQHWLNENGTPVTEGADEKVLLYIDQSVIPDVDTTDGWFSISKNDNGRTNSATWTRVIEGLPVYTADNNTYYAYTVEEAPIAGYSSEIFYDETGSTATAKIVNTPQSFEVVFKYYDRYELDGRPAGIRSDETVYSVPLNGIPNRLITYDGSHEVQSIDFSGLIGTAAVEFSEKGLSVNNVMCEYDLWTSQSAAVTEIGKRTYFVNGAAVAYSKNEIYHTDYLGKPHDHEDYQGQAASKDEKWVNYYDSKGVALEESFSTGSDYLKVNKIVVWCYNYPKLYNVDVYGANSMEDLAQKTVAGNTVYVADAAKTPKTR